MGLAHWQCDSERWIGRKEGGWRVDRLRALGRSGVVIVCCLLVLAVGIGLAGVWECEGSDKDICRISLCGSIR